MEKITGQQGMADTPQAQIYYKDRGDGIPILMLHGNAQTHLIFRYYEEQLSVRYRIILMDSRAHGHSRIKPPWDKREFTPRDMANDAAALLDFLHIRSCILIGFSDGANVALEFASLFPSRAIAVIAISGNSSPDGLILPVQLLSLGKYHGCKVLSRICGRVTGLQALAHIFFRQQQLAALLCHFPQLTEKQLAAIPCPVLLIAGDRDLVKASHSRRLAAQIPGAQLLLIKGGMHMSMFVHKRFYLRVILHFLEKL